MNHLYNPMGAVIGQRPAGRVPGPHGLRAPLADDDADRFGQALGAYANNDWAQAYAILGALADEGHRESARLALQMARHGQRLFGLRFELSARRQAHWVALTNALAVVTA